MTTTPRLGITQLEEGQALPEAVVNEGFVKVELGASRFVVLSKGDNSPAGGETDGQGYLVGSTGTGAFASHDDELAFLENGAWEFYTPLEGWAIEVLDEDTTYILRGGTWVDASSVSALDDLTDVNASAPTNGQVLTWDSTPGEWIAQDLPGAGAFVLGDATDVDTTGAASGNVLTYDGSQWEPAAPAGSSWALAGSGQTATGVWDFAVDGAKANVDFTGLAGATDIMIVTRNVTKSVAGVTAIRVSTDNGSTFYATSGDYVIISTAGVESNNDFFGSLHGTGSASARSGFGWIPGAGVSGAPKPWVALTDAAGTNRYFVASTSPINAVRILGAGGGNLTGGKIYCLAR